MSTELIVATAALAVAVLGLAVPVTIVVVQSRRPKDFGRIVVKPIRRWTKETFERAAQYLEKHIRLIDNFASAPGGENCLTRDDLCDWGIDLVLAAASNISPFSQGKANLFVVARNDIAQRVVWLRSKYFSGTFPDEQLLDADMTYRDMPVPYGQLSSPGLSVAGDALLHNRIAISGIKDAPFVSDIEKRLGTTHILGIPLFGRALVEGAARPGHQLKDGEFAVITVDFRFPGVLPFSNGRPWTWQRKFIQRRVERLQRIALMLFGQLSK